MAVVMASSRHGTCDNHVRLEATTTILSQPRSDPRLSNVRWQITSSKVAARHS